MRPVGLRCHRQDHFHKLHRIGFLSSPWHIAPTVSDDAQNHASLSKVAHLALHVSSGIGASCCWASNS